MVLVWLPYAALLVKYINKKHTQCNKTHISNLLHRMKLSHRVRRWPNFGLTSGQCLVFAGMCHLIIFSVMYMAAPMAHSYRLGLVTWGYQVRIPVGTDICHRGCAYTVLQTVQRHGVYSAANGTVHYKEPLKSFEIRVGHSPGFGLPSVAILP